MVSSLATKMLSRSIEKPIAKGEQLDPEKALTMSNAVARRCFRKESV